jgi:hypothetical protein
MKKSMMMLALATMAASLTLNADEAQKTQGASTAQKAQETAATKLSVEEQAFVAKLNDQNRKLFSDKLSAEQRKSVMVAVKNGANADEAVQKLIASKELKEAPAVVNAEKANASSPAVK